MQTIKNELNHPIHPATQNDPTRVNFLSYIANNEKNVKQTYL